MDTKLTLKLNEEVIFRAKRYAKRKNISLSRLIESYLDAISGEDAGPLKTTPLIEKLSGVIRLPKGFDYKKERGEHLDDKYS